MAYTVVGFFEGLVAADLVVTELTALGLGDEHIVLVAELDFDNSRFGHLRTSEPLGESLSGRGMSDAEAEIFAQGIRQGGVVVMVTAQDDQVDEISRIMMNHGAMDMEKGLPRTRDKVGVEPRPRAAASNAEPAALPFDPHKKPLSERMGGVKTYVHVE